MNVGAEDLSDLEDDAALDEAAKALIGGNEFVIAGSEVDDSEDAVGASSHFSFVVGAGVADGDGDAGDGCASGVCDIARYGGGVRLCPVTDGTQYRQ